MAIFDFMTKKQKNKPQKIQNLGYSRHGASTIKRSLTGWISTAGSPDDDIVENLEKLRERSRDLYMGAPLATGAIKNIRTNVIGSGLILNAQVDSEFLGLSPEQADTWERDVEREWRLWSQNENCDAARTLNFGQMQALVLLSALVSGDIFVCMPTVSRLGSVYDLKIQLLEGDFICDPINADFSKDILEGVEVDNFGAPVAYYIAKYHPAAYINRAFKGQQEWTRVEVFGRETGRRNILHIMADAERPGQRRGTPILAPVMEALKQVSRYTDAELMGAVVASMFTVFIKSNQPESLLAPGIPLGMQLDQTQEDNTAYELGNGSIVGLEPGEEIQTANPARPNSNFEMFMVTMAKQIGVALELPYEILLKTFNSSYTAARAAFLEAWKMYYMRRDWLANAFCRPVYEEWLAEAVAKGRINAPGFFDDPAIRAAWSGSDWFGPSQGSINPQVEAAAAEARVQSCFSTREREAAEITGMGYDRILKVRAREEARRRVAGLALDQNYTPIEPLPTDTENEDG